MNRRFRIALLLVAGCHGKYARPVSDEAIAATPERLRRGGYLVNQVMFCGACHTGREGGNILTEPERTKAFLGGGNVCDDKNLGAFWTPNLTPDAETGLGRWKDDEILRAIRDGVSRDGHFLSPLMPYGSYQHLSDDDARAVVAYLRSVPAYRQARPPQPNRVGLVPRILFQVVGVQMHEPAAGIRAPDHAARIEYGHYLARIGACAQCHSLTDRGPRPESDPLFLAGSTVPFEDAALGSTYARNLTPDPDTGLGNYDAAAIKQAIRAGRRLDGKQMASPMSILIPHLAGLTDDDVDALVAYLKSIPAVRQKVPDRSLVAALRQQLGD